MSQIGRYLAAQYLRAFVLAMAGGTGLFLAIDFLQRIGNLTRYEPTAAALVSYFLFKIPAVMTDVYPAAALVAVLVSVGLLSRQREILAMRACGMGTWQLAAPLIVVGTFTSLAVLAWSEFVVPPTATRYHDINDIRIKKKTARGLFNSSSLWLQALRGYANVQYFDANSLTLHRLTIYETDPSFRLTRIVEVPRATWTDDAWQLQGGTVKDMQRSGTVIQRDLRPGELALSATPRDFSKRRRSARDLSYRDLRREVDMLQARGIESTGLEIDLHTKLALPFSGLVSLLLGFPVALRVGRGSGMASALIVGLILGFAYWVTMAVALSVGRSGLLPPVAAAWAANAGATVVAASLFANAR